MSEDTREKKKQAYMGDQYRLWTEEIKQTGFQPATDEMCRRFGGGDLGSDLQDCGVPDHIHEGFARYVLFGILPGDFLQAVLKNSLMDAFGMADDMNKTAMWNIARFMHVGMPSMAIRTEDNITGWLKMRGLVGWKWDIENPPETEDD